MNFRAKLIDIEQGHNEVVLNSHAAAVLDLGVYDRVRVQYKERSVVALVDVSDVFIGPDQLGIFHEIYDLLQCPDGSVLTLEPAPRPASLDFIRKKLDGFVLSKDEISSIISDLMAQKLSTAELASFVSAVYTKGLSTDETAALTLAIIASGEVLHPPHEPVVSEHSIGGVAGGRASILFVPILASLGFCVPKTASRAISSATATADVMEVLAPVALSSKQILTVLEKANGCIVWGGAVNMAAADDKLIQIRNPLRLDPQPLLVASILAKKKAEGAQYVVLDIPAGRGVKVDSVEHARELARAFEVFSNQLGISLKCIISDGSEPLMHELGPALEARTVLRTLSSKGKEGSFELLQKSCSAAGVILHMVRGISREEGYKIALHQVESGRAYEQFKSIIAAQGGNPDVKPEDIAIGEHKFTVYADEDGEVSHVDNKSVSHVMRALGAPREKKAGMVLHAHKGMHVTRGEALFDLFATNEEALALAREALASTPVVELQRVVLEVV